MTELARSFPALRPKFEDADANGLAPWSMNKLLHASQPWSRSEKLIVSFLATVWDSDQDYLPGFNVVEAQKLFDRGSWTAFVGWAIKPFHC